MTAVVCWALVPHPVLAPSSVPGTGSGTPFYTSTEDKNQSFFTLRNRELLFLMRILENVVGKKNGL